MNFEAVKALVDEHLDEQESPAQSEEEEDHHEDQQEPCDDDDDDDQSGEEEVVLDMYEFSRNNKYHSASLFHGTPLPPNSTFRSVLEEEEMTDDESDYMEMMRP